MNKDRIISALADLGDYLLERDARLEAHVHRASTHNPWFTKAYIHRAIAQIAGSYLQVDALTEWKASYPSVHKGAPRRVGLIMAGNIPLVGMHDLISVLVSGHYGVVKLSAKDPYLLPFLHKKLGEIDRDVAERISIVPRLKDFDAVIATGSDNAATYFKSYFGKYPHVIRKNRNGIAVLDGNETPEDLQGLAQDIFSYFGLGCRNVSKIYLPAGYDFDPLISAIEPYRTLSDHPKYRNNLDYNSAVFILNKAQHLSLPHLMLVEREEIVSRIGVLHYGYYADHKTLLPHLDTLRDKIQCIASNVRLEGHQTVPFGKTQQPSLFDYADGVDTMAFLNKL